MKALVITSNERFQKRLTGILVQEGWDFSVTSSPEEALERVEEGDCSLILLDTLLPRTNGFDLCRRIKSLPIGASVPVILFGGSVVDGKEDIITLWGCEDFLPKTVEDEVLREILGKKASPGAVPTAEATPQVLSEIEEQPFMPAEEQPFMPAEEQPFMPAEEQPPMAAEEQPSARRGRLDEKSVLELFYDLHIEKWSGTLTLRNGEVEKAVYFDRGRPTFAITNQNEDKLGEWLVRIGRLSEVELKDALDISEREGKRLGGILVDMEIIKGEELRSLVQRHMEEIIFSLFEWEDGEYMVTLMDISSGEEILLEKSAGNVIMDGVRRRYTLDRMKKNLGPPSRVFRLSPNPTISLQDLRLSPSEAKLVDLIDGKRNVEEIISSSTLTPLNASRVLFCLLSVKIIEELGEGPAAEPKAPEALPLEGVFGLDPVALLDLDREALPPSAVDILKLFDGRRTLLQVVEESSYEREEALIGIQELLEKRLLKAVAVPQKPLSEAAPAPPLDQSLRAPSVAGSAQLRDKGAQPQVTSVGEPSIEELPPSPEISEPPEPLFVEEPQIAPEMPPVGVRALGGVSLKRILPIALPPIFVVVVIGGAMLYVKGRAPTEAGSGQTVQSVQPSAAIPVQPSPSMEQSLKTEVPQEAPAVAPIAESPPIPPEAASVPAPSPVVEQQKSVAERPRALPRESKIDRLRRAVAQNPNSVDALLNLGMALVERGNSVEGVLHIKKALSLAPGSPKAHFDMGKAYKILGDKQRAEAEFKEALRLEPSGPFSDKSMTQILELKKQ